ncbi:MULTISPECIES: DNA cytosine methyltransferase [Cryobacterium]|uniref:DNA cytosine methyltransferase n=1 Tax=Cryobacterium TaxID=69578 RepID=UPI000CD421BD|nr:MULTISPECIES: DNA cytosine methyltransferase [Cryobacterium]POH69949.1 DNA (cytosine-5-)-methyltransferase [Cryobacterium zongtaii]TFC42959.1 DNA cytosine methyltransferase [Cryobacterium sp. TMN-39-2]
MNTISVLDLFAGAGGLTAGFHEASDRFKTVRAVEMDTAAAASYGESFGRDLVYAGSIQNWLEHEVVPHVDVIVGGPPCQGFSTLGKQDAEDDRNSLWQQYAKTIVMAQPKYFVVENVAAFRKSRQFQDFVESTQRGGLIEDYAFEDAILNAADFGAFQARKRAVVIGYRRDLKFPGFPIPTHHAQPTLLAAHKTVRQAFEGIPSAAAAFDLPKDRQVVLNGDTLKGPFTANELHFGRNYSQLSLDRFAAIGPGGNRFQLPVPLQAPCWVKHKTGSGDVMGRLHWDRPSVTIRTEFFKPEKGRYLHPTAMRAITHYEAAVLQGFPPQHKFVGSKSAIARQIGNAVPIPLGAAIARQLLDCFPEDV